MALNITRGKKPSDIFYSNVDAFHQIPTDKLPIFLDFSSTYLVERKPLYGELVEELAKKVESTFANMVSAINFLNLIIARIRIVTKEELMDDLEKLEFDKGVIDQLLRFLEKNETKLDRYAQSERHEAVPRLVDINWRVDIRHASGDFLKEPSAYALVRLQVYDGEQYDQLYLELDKDTLSWLETTLNTIKAKFIEAEKIKERMYAREQS